MGMFDTVHTIAIACPLCGEGHSWQTKDGPQTLQDMTVHELMAQKEAVTFYGECDGCRSWIEVKLTRNQNQETSAQQVHRLVNEHVMRRSMREVR